jgi:hypothetical protein
MSFTFTWDMSSHDRVPVAKCKKKKKNNGALAIGYWQMGEKT